MAAKRIVDGFGNACSEFWPVRSLGRDGDYRLFSVSGQFGVSQIGNGASGRPPKLTVALNAYAWISSQIHPRSKLAE